MQTTPAHPLARYLRRSKTSMREIARRSGVDVGTISRVLRGRDPSRLRFTPEAARAISKATGWKVSFADLCKPVPARVAESAA